jgi:hypothetical protein
MRLHASVIEKLLYIVQNYGGHEHDHKLRSKLQEIDLTPYERRNTPGQEVILVLTEDYMKQLAGTAGR